MKKLIMGLLTAASISFTSNSNAQQATALLYNGNGSSPTDVVAIQGILGTMGISYHLVNHTQLNAMPLAVLQTYKLIVWPGGNSIVMGNSLSKTATTNVKKAVSNKGVSYIGFCAGAFMAESSTYYNVFNLAGVWFDFYRQSITDIVRTYFADGKTRDLVYWDGPHLKGFGKVIARYPNGLPAMAANKVGKGFVVLTGVHPEAPEDWRWGFVSPDTDGVSADIDYTKLLIKSALTKVMLPTF